MLYTMNENELNRIEILTKINEKRLNKRQAADLLKLSVRQIQRLQNAFNQYGPEGVISKKRGKPSNRRYPETFRNHVINLIRDHYSDFGPTLTAEKLAERHGISIAIETVRQWMKDSNLWQTRAEQRRRVYQPRNRRNCVGELIQIDGSQHWWLEERGPKCTLLVYIDDASSRIQHLKFVPSESTFDYFSATREYIELHGKPIAFYSDKHSTFRVNSKEAKSGNGMTQFGRALHELNIDIICANSPQAKGRVERANKTLQDRLVKELRLERISEIETANAYLPYFITAFNDRFAKPPKSDQNVHRPLADYDDMDRAFSWQETRTVTRSLSVQYDRVVFLLEPTEVARSLARKKVTINDYPDGRLEIRHDGVTLPYSIFDKVRKVNQASIVHNKRLSSVLELVKNEQAIRSVNRSRKGPKRRGQSNSIFS